MGQFQGISVALGAPLLFTLVEEVSDDINETLVEEVSDDINETASHDLPHLQCSGVCPVRGLGDRLQGYYLDQASSTSP